MTVDTPGGRIHVQWDHDGSATPNTQLTFFAELLATTGLDESWVNSCPLSCSSPNAHSKRDVLGTWLLGVLAGHKHYAHITGLRGDAVSPLLDIDTTIKPLYGKQSGAEVARVVPCGTCL